VFSSVLGTVFYTAVVFIVGGIIGRPLYTWVNKMMPWSKST